jgi:dolichyl-phosphate-mannose--protein O-mannosyl transferase
MIESVPMAVFSGIRRQVALLLAVGALTHFAGLTSPRQVVFDEVTFGQYVQAYCCTGERFFDIHPPHGKLLIALAAKIGGFDRSFVFEKIGQPYDGAPVAALRFVPALAGTLIPLLFFLFLRELKASPPIALAGGLLVALDNGFLVETRLLLIDGILMAATLGSLVCFLVSQRTGRWWALVSAGLLAGLATGTKLTGLAAPGLILLCLAFGLGVVDAPLGRRVRQGLVVIAAAVVVYLAGWVVHWLILPNPGPGDAFYQTTGRIVTDLINAQRTMLSANVGLTATHPDASAPWTWPLMKVAPYFWQGDGSAIYMVGNPVVWWGTSMLFFALLVQIAVMGPIGVPLPAPVNAAPRVWMPLAGFFLAYLPFFRVTRVLFLYHYLTPLLFSLAFVLLWLDRAGWARPGDRPGRVSYLVIIGLAVAGFLIMSPLTYGFSLGGYNEWLAAVVRSWR